MRDKARLVYPKDMFPVGLDHDLKLQDDVFEIVEVGARYHLDRWGEFTRMAPDVWALLRRKDCRPGG